MLDDSWQKTIANDLETIQSEGHDAVRKVDANMVVKKKGGKDVEVPDGWAGHILPFDLVQEKLLSADLAEIGTYESRLRLAARSLTFLKIWMKTTRIRPMLSVRMEILSLPLS